MFTELIDLLRCPNAHEDSWLVASSSRSIGRHIVAGRLGCPVCRSSFEIVDGEPRFSAPVTHPAASAMSESSAFRLAAQLHLVEAPEAVLLTGAWSAAVDALLRIAPTIRLVIGDRRVELPLDERVSALTLPALGLPFAAGALRGVALDADHASTARLTDCARVVRAGGRLVAPASVSLDEGAWTVVARDEQDVVAERRAVASAPVQIRRAPVQPLFDA